MTVRVRFAPSPTGNLHIGGARTALFNWVFARSQGGKFLLRIEDTDLERSTDESRQAILEALEWLGLTWDEEIVTQSERRPIHEQIAQKLLEEGKAYKCFSTQDELAAMRERAMTEGRTRTYERTWRDRTDHPEGQPFVVRLKMPTTGQTVLHDEILGDITVENDNLDDYVILRSDGSPTYNFVVVCDDSFMGITHVVRGQDHTSNTFRQIHLYHALGEPLPRFAHMPLISGLSKRKGSVSVQHYRDAGIIREGLLNYIARLGWSRDDIEIVSVDELTQLFRLSDVNNSSARYDEEKLQWVNSQWIKQLDAADIATRLLPFLRELGAALEDTPSPGLVGLVRALQPRAENLVDMAAQARFAFFAPESYDDKAVSKWIRADALPAYEQLIQALEALSEFSPEAIDACVAETAEAFEIKMGKLAQPVRIAITGSAASPPIGDTLSAVGQQGVLERLRAALSLFADLPPTP